MQGLCLPFECEKGKKRRDSVRARGGGGVEAKKRRAKRVQVTTAQMQMKLKETKAARSGDDDGSS